MLKRAFTVFTTPPSRRGGRAQNLSVSDPLARYARVSPSRGGGWTTLPLCEEETPPKAARGSLTRTFLQTPKGKEFWLAGFVVETGEQIRYKVPREEWSVHFNVSQDGKLFAGDGGGPESVAAPGNGQWIYLFRPKNGAGNAINAERLVNLATHDYSLEPNVTFTPDGKWIVFRSNLFGETHVYAVEVEKR